MFTTLVLMTGITSAIPYGFSALAQMKWRWIDHKTTQTPRFVRDMVVAVISLLFSILFIWYSRNTGHSLWEVWAPFFLAAAALLPVMPRGGHHRQCRGIVVVSEIRKVIRRRAAGPAPAGPESPAEG